MAFKQGKSGNPAGRPRGRPDKRAQWRKELEKHGNALVAKAVELALDGDSQALKLCIDRAIPAYRPTAEPVSFAMEGDTLTSKAESILAAVAAGELDPLTGKSLIDAIGSLVKVTEIDDVHRRLAELEGANNA
jgi:hypothetical protein